MRVTVDYSVQQEAVQDTMRSQLKFYFPEIIDVTFGDRQICIESDTTLPEEKIKTAALKIVKKFERVNGEIPSNVLYDSETSYSETIARYSCSDTYGSSFRAAANEMMDRLSQIPKPKANPLIADNVYRIRKGLNIYSSVSSELIQALDHFFKRFFQLEYGAEETKPPSMISSSVVHRSGYFSTGCQHISFVSPISNDPDVFDQFLPYWNATVDSQGSGVPDQLYRYTKIPRDILNPAICLHCYPMFENKQITENEAVAITMSGSVFRDESGNLNNEYRLNEFQMREGIFIGRPALLEPIHRQQIRFMIQCGFLFGFKFRIETANDIFFNDNAMQQLMSQLASDNKIELSVYSGKSGKEIAIASLNKHHTHFSKSFNIVSEDNQLTHTMCAAFGLNRFEHILSEKIEQEGVERFIDGIGSNLDALLR